jgi:hypothetical protein
LTASSTTAWNIAPNRARGLVGPLLLLASLLVVGLATSSSFFFSDDFVNFQVAHDSGLTPALLNQQLFGHWIPGRRLLDWIVQRHRPVSWPLVLFGMLVLVGVAALVLRRVVQDLVGSKVLSWAVAILLPLTGGMAGTVQWYSGAAEPIPAMPLTLGAMLFQLWFIRRGNIRTLIGSLLLLFGSLAFDERAIVLYATFPVLLLLVEPLGQRRRVIALEATAVAALALYLIAQHHFTQGTPPTARPNIGVLTDFIFRGVVQSALPSEIGLEPRATISPVVLTAIGLAMLVGAVAVAVLARQRRVVFAVGWYLALSLLVFALTGWVRAAEFGAASALEPRYAAVLMPVGLIAAAFAAHAILASRPSRPRASLLVAPVAVIAAAVTIGLVTLSLNTVGAPGRAWWTKVDAYAASHPAATFFDFEVPSTLVASAFFPASLFSNVVAVLDPSLVVGPSTRTATAFTDSGRAFNGGISSTGTAALHATPGLTAVSPKCWQIDNGEGSLVYEVAPLQTADRTYIQARITTTGPLDLTVLGATTADDTQKGFGGSASTELHGGSSWVTLGMSRQKIGDLKVSFTGHGEVCVADLIAGKLTPATGG